MCRCFEDGTIVVVGAILFPLLLTLFVQVVNFDELTRNPMFDVAAKVFEPETKLFLK